MPGSERLVLGIDTCGALGSVALARLSEDGGLVTLEEATLPGKSYSALLVSTVRNLLQQAAVSLGGLSAMVVVKGPGSFTGVRVGLSAAKGFSEASGVPLIAVSRLAVLASKAEHDGAVCAVLDAGRKEFYVGCYGGSEYEALLDRDETRACGDGALAVVCEPSVAEALAACNPRIVDAPTAADAIRQAVPRILAGDSESIVLLDGNYLRRSDAEIFAKPKPSVA